MTRALLVLLVVLSSVARGQDTQEVAKRGAQIFAASCTGYCHGEAGSLGGSAPRLAGRGLDEAYINSTISNGVSGTAMPAFADKLPRADVVAVVAYVAGLNGRVGGGSGSAAARPSLSGDAERGRQLFSDALRSFDRCSTCHEINGVGIPVTTPIRDVPEDVEALRRLRTPQVRTASADGETMPALVVSKASRAAIYYDLTTPPPVLRTVPPASVTFTDGSSWQHSSVIGSYTNGELALVLTYMRAVTGP
jgi:mono/diheme cytochrome c family protein